MSTIAAAHRLRLSDLALIALPALVALALLVPFVGADPVAGITVSSSPFTDETWSIANARSWALFGTFTTDQWGLYLLTMPFTLLDGLVFRIFGVGLMQARIVDIACVAATGSILVAGLRRPYGRPAAVVAGVAFVTSTLVLYYGRMAYLEPMAGLFLAAGTLTLLGIDGERPGRAGLLGGLLLALAVGTKAVTLPAVGMILVLAAVAALRSRAARRWVAGAGSAFAGSGLAWAIWVALPNLDGLEILRTRIYPQLDPLTVHRAVVRVTQAARTGMDGFLPLAGPLLVAAAVGLAVSAPRRRAPSAGAPSAGAALLVWASAAAVVAGILAPVLAGYAPNRYFVPLLPLLAILAAPAFSLVLRRVTGSLAPRTHARHTLVTAGVALGLALLMAAQGLVLHASWMRDPGHDLAEAQARAAAVIPDGAIVAGPDASLLGLTTRATLVIVQYAHGGVNAGDLYASGARWWAATDPPTWASLHPEAWATATREVCLEAWGIHLRQVCLWHLP